MSECTAGNAQAAIRLYGPGLTACGFADTPEALAEWTSARNVFGPVHTSSEKPVAEQKPVSQEVTPPAGGEPGKAA